MRCFALTALSSCGSPPPQRFGAELTGTVQVAGRPAQHAVVWLAASGAPAGPATEGRARPAQPRSSPRTCWPCASARRWTSRTTTRCFTTSSRFATGRNSISGCIRKAPPSRIVFDKPGLARLFCNIHPNMAAYVMAVDSPYFAVSNEDGTFTIAGVPPGTYTYHAWRPGGQPLTGSITVDGEHSSRNPLVGTARASLGIALVMLAAAPARAQRRQSRLRSTSRPAIQAKRFARRPRS